MFFCQVSGKMSQPGEKLNKVVVKSREKVYTQMIRNEETRAWEEVEVGHGWEIVQELNATQAGVAKFAAMSDEDKARLVAVHQMKLSEKITQAGKIRRR